MKRQIVMMSHLTPYPRYRDSGVPWLGEIPAHWEVKRLKYVASLNPESLREDTDPESEIVYVDVGGVDSLGRIVEKELLSFGSAPTRARRIVRDGDVIVSTVRTYLRAIAKIREPEPNLVVSTGFAVIRPIRDLSSDYAAYALRSPYFVERVVAHSKGVSFPAINESEMATFDLALPPLDEQRAIAAFLDREIAKIDALIAKKERLIELLAEKRSALIVRAVTKGLDPNVPMKHSGVEWLGEIPAHWQVKRLKYIAPFRNRILEDNDNDLPYVNMEQVEPWTGRLLHFAEPEAVESTVVSFEAGDVLFGKLRPYLAKVLLPDFQGVCSGEFLVMRPTHECHSKYLFYCFLSYTLVNYINSLTYGTKMPRVNPHEVGNIMMPLPSLDEQNAIAAFLDSETAKIDALSAKIRESIALLNEYRTALVTAAVTGQIDVRSAVDASGDGP